MPEISESLQTDFDGFAVKWVLLKVDLQVYQFQVFVVDLLVQDPFCFDEDGVFFEKLEC